MDPLTFVPVFGLIGIIILLMILNWAIPVRLWIEAIFSGVRVSIGDLIGMRLRKVNPAAVVRPLIMGTKAGLQLSPRPLEAHYLAGGNVERVVKALISADKANLGLDFKQATAIDLAGRDVLEAVKVSVNPKVIDTPRVAAMAKDGIQLIATARVTIRANINRLVGGAGEDTILARVGEGIVSTIGSAESHKAVLSDPDNISKTVLAKGLDAGTAFEILSIDIADVDVGKNIGAELQTDQAEADKRIAQAKAEERRAMAIAAEQEMRARVQEMRAHVVEAEAQVPQAMADAFRNGNLGIMDYARYRNVVADTDMRRAIAGGDDGHRPPTQED
ncbi:MAG TPA: flotillin-like protein FloA [Longimicrobiales bacterium]|nr:flotillin-like protein FloA [Longimicrobiales bacterium]